MDPNSVKSTLSNLAFGNVMAAAARDYQKVYFVVLLFKLIVFSKFWFHFPIFTFVISLISTLIDLNVSRI